VLERGEWVEVHISRSVACPHERWTPGLPIKRRNYLNRIRRKITLQSRLNWAPDQSEIKDCRFVERFGHPYVVKPNDYRVDKRISGR